MLEAGGPVLRSQHQPDGDSLGYPDLVHIQCDISQDQACVNQCQLTFFPCSINVKQKRP